MAINQHHPTYEDLELLVEVSQLLAFLDVDQVLQRVIDLTAKAVGATKASLFLHDGDKVDWSHIFTARALGSEESVRVVTSVLDKGLAGWVVRNREAAIVYDTEKDERWHVFPDDEVVVRSAMCLPFMNDGEVVAVVTLVHPEPNHFQEYQLRYMTIVVNQSTVAIRNAQLFSRLENKQQQLQAVLQSVPDMLFVTDDQGHVRMTNDGALRFLNLTAREIYNLSLEQLATYSTIFQPVLEVMRASNSSQHTWHFDARSERRQRDLVVTMSRWDDENRGGFVFVMHDVTQMRDLNRFKDEILHLASHDLRSPLSLISGYTDMIELDAPGGSPIHEYVDVIHRSVKKMNNLLEDMLRIKQVDANRLNLEKDVPMYDFVRDVAVNIQPLAERKHQELRTEFSIAKDLKGTIDPVLLRQAMENFASNAVKYTPERGVITIRTYLDEDLFHFEVQDSGIGIPEDAIKNLFQQFYRVHQPGTENIEGTGLGLSLVKSIVERHQGEVWVQSEEGIGSIFGMRLPI